MELVKKSAQPAQNLSLTGVTTHSKSVDYSKNGIVIAINTATKSVVDGVKRVGVRQTCFKLKVVNPSSELLPMFV